ncbi:Armadillo-type fold protein [Cordyceps fumosorosea ARSEF 2679]|uniref:Armadillo-type fold protein n=1 Tax=Cordyceps fumosorosea (strain ARSEF 2679) TaxID=1081104 RepID=A0A162MSE4_CORFA|nr:Armadillo-type fold protein [Cordyceps fumosorosea ARSEF 2679]OAA69529.1 Armadillo-type fold protein [Cordyceps fumosorosea ARSEF 2679]
MEDQLLQLLAATAQPDQNQRMGAEMELKRVQTSPAYSVSLANIASHTAVDIGTRQLALSTLRLFIENNWSNEDPGADAPIPIADDTRQLVRQSLLDLALSSEDDRKVKIAASYALGKIAIHDFPEQWPSLLPTVLSVFPNGNDSQLHGALRVLGDLVEESLTEDQFFTMARDIAIALTQIATSEDRKPLIRSLAISVFRGCFDLMSMVKEDHATEVTAFAEELLKDWNPFFLNVLKSRLPETSNPDNVQPTEWNSIISLKLQVVKTLLRIRRVFPNLLLPQSTTLFTAVWEELLVLLPSYEHLYINNDAQGRLEDVDSLPYTLDFLVLEELDFLNQCFRAPPVQAELDRQLKAHAAHEVPWMVDIMKLLGGYARVIREEEELWDIDCSLFLAEETSVTANYTARTAAGDLLIKMGEWFNDKTIDGLFGYTKELFPSKDWRSQEAALYLFVMLASDFQDVNKAIPEIVAHAYLELVDYAINRAEEPLLRARGYLVAGILGRSYNIPLALVERIINFNTEESEVVQVACVKAITDLIEAGKVPVNHQLPIINAIKTFMEARNQSEMQDADELLVTLTAALRAAIGLNHEITLSSEVGSVDLLFLLAKLGSNNFQVTVIVSEIFEELCISMSDQESFSRLSAIVIPNLTSAFDANGAASDSTLVSIAIELLDVVAENAPCPLPEGFVAAILPQLSILLMQSTEGDILRNGSRIVKSLLANGHQQVLSWHDADGRSGLEVCLVIVDRLLGPSIEDNSASEVGGLAAEIVEKAGQERLGPFLLQLLQAVANRLAVAQAAAIIQSLILVFARLSLNGAQDVVEFLSQIQINPNENGLQVVMSKWLENSVSFAGYDEIRQNVIALSKLFALNDSRLKNIIVKGDLVVDDDGMIKTRSRSKQRPDQYSPVPAQLKIVKVLIEELLSASGVRSAANLAAAAVAGSNELDEDDGEDGWEDDETLDMTLNAVKGDLMSYMDNGGQRQPDDETQAYLTDFFIRASQENIGDFNHWYPQLQEAERQKLSELAHSVAQ